MENRRKFKIIDHYLIEIDDVQSFNGGTFATTYSWDIYIASCGDEYRGKAIEYGKDIKIPWTTLREHNLDDEMIKLVETRMANL